eukprot:GHVP01002338.1.p1 GENE.GHVP01002338.1~~GHVP01002338.1.p1  ORF type:complete len:301 (+),score=61.03 GHVP01002338.1:726-1628(+)
MEDFEMKEEKKKPTAIVVIGMAGSGKTTFVKALQKHFKQQNKKIYAINLDPACLKVPFPRNIDIRDTINYRDVMKSHNLGPNGAILTCLNMFAAQFDGVLTLMEKRAEEGYDYFIIDTPGQIEVFNWSASGTIILDGISMLFPTVVTYIIDTARCERAITFMTNLTYACSVLYRTKLPFVAVFNKTDVRADSEAKSWMNNYEEFADALLLEESYMASLSRSTALAMTEFYKEIRCVGVSSALEKDFDQFEVALNKEVERWHNEYLPWLKRNQEANKKKAEMTAEKRLLKFTDELEKDKPQ